MITFLSFASKKNENVLLKDQLRIQAARWTEEAWVYELFEELEQVEEYLSQDPLLDIVSWDVTVRGAVERLKDMRRRYQQAFLLVVADGSVSPMVYLRPGILPSSLLLKPLKKENLAQVIGEMMEAFAQRFEEETVPEVFVIESREGKQYVPLQQICYVEAREKKVYIRTKKEEFGFYDTIESMEKQLPGSFCRCHRSYIVNMAKVRKVKASQNLIELLDGLEVPLSRSYKKTIKEYYNYDPVD